MATQEEIKTVRLMLEEYRPFGFVEKIDVTNKGIASILRCLSKQDAPLTAGEISERIGVSTARIAVLLRKMSGRKLIVTGDDPSDARKTLVCISDHGKELLNKIVEERTAFLSTIIDRLGLERMKEFIKLSKEIENIFCEIADKK